jgi:hypothetical protein
VPRHWKAYRQWAKEHPEPRDRAWFLREVTPKLDPFSLAEIAARWYHSCDSRSRALNVRSGRLAFHFNARVRFEIAAPISRGSHIDASKLAPSVIADVITSGI